MKKLEASAIYYALFLSVIFGLILGGFVLFSGFNQNFAMQIDIQEQLMDNAHSGIAYGQVNFKELEYDQPLKLRLFGEGVDSVEITKKSWGGFTVIHSKANHRNRFYEKIALLGALQTDKQPNLYLVDNGRPISLCGDARIEGLCYLPIKGLKRAYIAGKNYQGSKLVYGTVNSADKQLPQIEKSFIEGVESNHGELNIWDASADSLNRSFTEKAAHYVADDYMSIQRKTISGQVILEAKDSIFIGRNAQIQNAILKSKVVYIETGFSGTLQIFASEKIVLEEGVQLKYPSIIGVIETGFSQEKTAEITIGKGSQVLGAVFLLSEEPNFRNLPKLTISREAEVDGMVYCAGKAELKGTVVGSLYAQKLALKTASSSYENHLLDGKVLNQLPPEFITPNLLNETRILKPITWLQ